MDIKYLMKELCLAPGVSGDEHPASLAAAELLKKYTDNVKIDFFGNVTAFVGEEKKPLILLDAHIDRIGMVVTHIDDDGFVKVGGIGLDRRTLLAQRVTVHGKKDVKGVICTLPPHIAKEGDKAPKIEEISIDVGLSKEKAKKIISLGDTITIDGEFSELCGDVICAPATDDRAGVASLLCALEILSKEKDLPFRIAVLFSVQEEVGGRGAEISAFNIAPDFAIAVDVSFAKSGGTPQEVTCELGKGPMIGFSPCLDRALSKKLVQIAEEKQIPYQIEVMSSSTGTNADDISASRSGVRTMLVSVPQRYMHTPCEVLDVRDIERTGELIAAFIKNTTKDNVSL